MKEQAKAETKRGISKYLSLFLPGKARAKCDNCPFFLFFLWCLLLHQHFVFIPYLQLTNFALLFNVIFISRKRTQNVQNHEIENCERLFERHDKKSTIWVTTMLFCIIQSSCLLYLFFLNLSTTYLRYEGTPRAHWPIHKTEVGICTISPDATRKVNYSSSSHKQKMLQYNKQDNTPTLHRKKKNSGKQCLDALQFNRC